MVGRERELAEALRLLELAKAGLCNFTNAFEHGFPYQTFAYRRAAHAESIQRKILWEVTDFTDRKYLRVSAKHQA